LVYVSLACIVYFRFGLLTLIVELSFSLILMCLPVTTQLSAWYSRIALTGLAYLLALALWAFHSSLGGQPMFGRASLED
jgi:hypothetical protein